MADDSTRDFLSNLIEDEAWIGGFKLNAGDWQWADETEWGTSEYWADGQPDQSLNSWDAAIYTNNRWYHGIGILEWYDGNKEEIRHYVCQYFPQ